MDKLSMAVKARCAMIPEALVEHMMTELRIRNLGQIQHADIAFGDLTVLVGPQATGKSITVQLLKLLVDTGYVQHELRRYGMDWSRKLPEFFDLYFGEGMQAIWSEENSTVVWNGKNIDMSALIRRVQKSKPERLFAIPAQRVLALRDGWPRPFTDYAPGDPFSVREFSEKLRVLVEREFTSEKLFPQKKRLKGAFRELLERNLFSSFQLKIDKFRSQRRLVLGNENNSPPLPYMVWSAGQREFVPLLLGFYWLMPPTKAARRASIEWIVIEELEMGLHPSAISVVVLMVFELLHRGYKVCLSTHSPQVLECVWALRNLRRHGANAQALLQVFDARRTRDLVEMAESVLEKKVNVYYFDRTTHTARDISALDVAEVGTPGEDGWGGLADFSSRVNEAVASAVANSRQPIP
jgi:hypothetical protein